MKCSCFGYEYIQDYFFSDFVLYFDCSRCDSPVCEGYLFKAIPRIGVPCSYSYGVYLYSQGKLLSINGIWPLFPL